MKHASVGTARKWQSEGNQLQREHTHRYWVSSSCTRWPARCRRWKSDCAYRNLAAACRATGAEANQNREGSAGVRERDTQMQLGGDCHEGRSMRAGEGCCEGITAAGRVRSKHSNSGTTGQRYTPATTRWRAAAAGRRPGRTRGSGT